MTTRNRDHLVYPPTNDYSVTLPEVIDFHRKNNPQETVFVFAEDDKRTPTEISHLEFGRAADRVAHYINPGRKIQEREVIAFVALTDSLLYQAVTIGITRAGFIPYPMSPRNAAAAIIKMLKETNCHRLLTTYQTLRPLVDEITNTLKSTEPSYELAVGEVPPLFDIFPNLGNETSEDPFEEYPAGPRLPLDDVLIYLHSSGSTGFPKTITQTFRTMIHWAGMPSVTEYINYHTPLTIAGHALPSFHTLGLIVQVLTSMYSMVRIGLYPPIASRPFATPMMPTPDNILDHITRSRSNGLVIIPALLQVWAQDKASVDLLARLEFVGYSGGALPSKLGNFMSESGVYVAPIYGATEFGAPSRSFRDIADEKDWEYISFSDRSNVRWDPQGDGTFESQFLTSSTHQVSVENLDDVKGYASSDLWVQHPTKSHLWKIVGRKDDVIVHTSGEKTVPAPMEDILNSSPYIMGVTMFGRDRDQAGVLVELKPSYTIDINDEEDVIGIRNMLWPIIEEANKVCPAFSRIFKEMILIASREKPLPRAGKGTIMRKAALALYASEIDEIYAKVEATSTVDAVIPPLSWLQGDIVVWLQEQIEEMSGKAFTVADDIFDQGMDSLSATILRRRILGAMQSEESQKAVGLVTQVTIYNNPTILKLAGFLSGIVADPVNFNASASRVDAIDQMISKYSVGLHEPIAGRSIPRGPLDEAVILLTGSTGNLGAQMLESLLCDPRVRTVYALNRASSGSKTIQERQEERFVDKALNVSLLDTNRIVYLEGDASQRYLGLSEGQYNELSSRVTTIIHNAWRLDFNLTLSSFEANVQGTRNLIDMARAGPNPAAIKFLFTSSVSCAFSWDQSQGAYPEDVLLDSRYAVGNGYGESKYVAERILAQSGLQGTSFRIGQITGGHPNGAWATSDWVPILVKSSLAMNVFPSATGVTAWLPMDAVSQAILDVSWSAQSPPALNVVHPRPVSWNTILDNINDAIVEEGIAESRIPTATFGAWVTELEKHATGASSETINNIPAIKLLDFFRFTSSMDDTLRQLEMHGSETGGLASFSTTKVEAISETMEALPTIGQSHASQWVKYWKGVGFI